MQKTKTSVTLLIILNLGLLCTNQNLDAAQKKSNTKPVQNTSTKSSSAGEKNADQTEMDKIVMAIQDGDIAKVQNAIIATPDIVKRKDRNGCHLLYYAVIRNQKDIAEYLLRKGSNITDTDKTGVPLLLNPFLKDEMMQFLVANGADIKQTDNHKESVLHLRSMNTNTISFLIAKGANVNAKNSNDVTPLHIAVISKRKDLAEILLVNGADINAKDKSGSTPLHKAISREKEMVIYLIEKGADLNAKDNKGRTPYSLAIESRNSEMVKIFEERGAK